MSAINGAVGVGTGLSLLWYDDIGITNSSNAADVQSVQNVINNLLISHMEIRTDQAIDVRMYIHTKQLEVVVVCAVVFVIPRVFTIFVIGTSQ